MITYTNSLDFCPGGVPLFVRLSQYDSDFSLVFNCFSHKGDFTIENGSTAVFREHKPDGNVISIDAMVSGTIVTLTPSAANAKQMTAIKGHCECEISLQKNGKELSSANFVLLVEKAPVDIDAVQSDSVIRELYDVADRAEEILEAAQTVDEAISDLPNLIDSTLTLPNHAADAKKTGDEITGLKIGLTQTNNRIDDIEPGLSEDAKAALLACFQHIAFLDDDDDYYTNLRDALYASDELVSLSAVFNQGSTVIYPDESLDNLRTMLVVTGLYTDGNTRGISNYRLSGTLVGDTLSVITVSYRDKTTTFAVAVTEYEWGSDYTWLYRADTDGLLSENENVSEKTVIAGVSGTETLIDGVLNLSAPYTTSGGGNVFKLIPLVCTNAVLKAKVKFNSLAESLFASGLRLQLSNGTKGAQMFAFKHSDNGDYRISTHNEGVQVKLAEIQLNRWYILSCEIKPNNTQTLKIDDAVYNINALASYANTESRVIVQNPGGQTDSGNVDVDIAWISFKNNA